MEDRPLKSVNLHFRFKFLAISTIAFLMFIILSSTSEFDQFASTFQFKLMGPFFLISGIMYIVFRKFPIKCPHCSKILPTRTDWKCPSCERMQGTERYLMDKCTHCRQILADHECSHCGEKFRL